MTGFSEIDRTKISKMMTTCITLLKVFKVEKTHFTGLSLGGLIAIQFTGDECCT